MSNIILKTRDGIDVEHSDIEKIRVNAVDGSKKFFIDESLVPNEVEVTVDLDFSVGDMEVVPDNGTVFSKVNIIKPINLIPENIAKDANIAGVIGVLSGGGSLSNNDIENSILKYFVYQIDNENKEIIVYGVLYTQLYNDTGSWDLSIPSNIGGYSIIIDSEGVR